MTYFQFLFVFCCLPIVVLSIIVRTYVTRAAYLTAAFLAVFALLYTAPWDNAIVLNGVWSYTRQQVSGLVIGVVPLEEYLFYGLQVVAIVLLCIALSRHKSKSSS